MELAEKHAFDGMNHQGILKVYLKSSGRRLICHLGTLLWRSFTIISVERLLLAVWKNETRRSQCCRYLA